MPRFKLRVPTQLDRSQDEEALGPTRPALHVEE